MFDRNTLLAILLSALVLIGYSYFFQPKTQPQKSTSQQKATTKDPSAPNPGQSAAYQEPFAPVANPLQQTPENITVKTPLYTAIFSTKGGTLKSFTLNKYKHHDGKKQVELVASSYGALALKFTTPQNKNVDTRALFFKPSQTGNLTVNDKTQVLSFSTPINDGLLKQTYTFDPKTYEVLYQVETQKATNFMSSGGYELAWMGGLPFSEDVIEREAEMAQSVVRHGGETIHHDISAAKGRQNYSGNIEWMGVKNRFFLATVIPQQATKGAELHAWMKGEAKTPKYWEDYSAKLALNRPTQTQKFKLFLGPQDYDILKKYNTGLEDLNITGWFSWVSRFISHYVIQPVFNVLKGITSNYGIIIFLFALLIKIVTHPLTKKSQQSMAKMKVLQPKMQELQEKYKDDPTKLQQQMGKLYQQEKINPLGGCVPMLLQMPILITMYSFFPTALNLRQEPFLWAKDLSAPDILFHLPFTIPFYGNFITGFALLMAITMVVQMQVQGDTQPANPANVVMKWFFPVMLLCLFNNFASGLNWYYFVFNILSIGQQYYMNKQLKDKEALAATEKAAEKGTVTVGGAPKTKKKKR